MSSYKKETAFVICLLLLRIIMKEWILGVPIVVYTYKICVKYMRGVEFIIGFVTY